MKCCVLSCKNSSDRRLGADGITFHLFPYDEKLKQQWITKINRQGWTPTKYTKLCSCHFNVEDFRVTEKGLRKLKKGTLPSLKLDLSLKTTLPEPTISSPKPTISSPKPTISPPKPTTSDSYALLISRLPRKKLEQDIALYRWQAKEAKLKIRSLLTKVSRLQKKVGGTSTAKPVVRRPHVGDPECGRQSRKRKKQGAPKPVAAKPQYSDSSEMSDALVDGLAAGGGSRLCCCCRSAAAAGAAPLAGPGGSGSGATYMDMLDRCFDITYPEGLEPTASICLKCISTLKQGVRFKRRALQCRTTMTTRPTVDEVANVKEVPDQPDDAVFQVQTISSTPNPSYCYVLGGRINFLEKIKEGNDLSKNYEETHVNLEEPIDANCLVQTTLFAEETDQTEILTENGMHDPLELKTEFKMEFEEHEIA